MINGLVYKLSENNEKCPSQFTEAQVNVIKCLVLSDQQSKRRHVSFISHKTKKSSISHNRDAGESSCLVFLLKNADYISVDVLLSG